MDFYDTSRFKNLHEAMNLRTGEETGATLNPGLTDAEADEFQKLVEERFGCPVPTCYLRFLKIMNGCDLDDKVIYGHTPSAKGKMSFIERNQYHFYFENMGAPPAEAKLEYFIIGCDCEVGWYYVYNIAKGAYAFKIRNEQDQVEYITYDSFEEMFLDMYFAFDNTL